MGKRHKEKPKENEWGKQIKKTHVWHVFPAGDGNPLIPCYNIPSVERAQVEVRQTDSSRSPDSSPKQRLQTIFEAAVALKASIIFSPIADRLIST